MTTQTARFPRLLAVGLAAVGVSLAVGTAGLAYSAGARRAAPPAAVVAVFDLEKIFMNLDERKTKEGELKAYSEQLQKELDALANIAKDEASKADMMPDGPGKRAAIAKALEARANAQVKQKVSEAMIEQKRADTFIELYNKVNAGVKKMAQQNGYTIVLSTDEAAGIPPQAQTADIQRIMQLKRVFYTAPGHDISDELVTMLNNEFKAGVGAAPSGG